MDLKLPKLGEGADSGTVVSILVQEGEQIKTGQTILELENEKAVAPIPATADGVVGKIRVKVGDVLSVGQVILTLAGDTSEPAAGPADSPSPSSPTPAPREDSSDQSEPEDTPAQTEPEFQTSAPVAPPSIRRMAREIGLDLGKIRGTGPGGRIGLGDVRQYIQRLQALTSVQRKEAKSAGSSASAPVPIDFSQWGPVTRKPLTPLRQTIARRMTEHWNTVPHVTQFDEIDVTDLNELRKRHLSLYEAQGAKLTLTPLVIKAVVKALRKHPLFNASLDESTQEVVYKDYYHIGLAVDTEQGLLVPVLRDADRKSVLELSREVLELADQARSRRLSLEQMRGGTFTISNQGGIGGGFFTPIINKPEVAILGLGRSVIKPVVREGHVVPRLLMPIGLSYDHRLIDGGTAARFTVDLADAFQGLSESDVKL